MRLCLLTNPDIPGIDKQPSQSSTVSSDIVSTDGLIKTEIFILSSSSISGFL